eukprot:m.175642 g.175642  ORF g.175642 m.175642 type:complete len:197 (+) comp31828_c0_seq8:1-591(+)
MVRRWCGSSGDGVDEGICTDDVAGVDNDNGGDGVDNGDGSAGETNVDTTLLTNVSTFEATMIATVLTMVMTTVPVKVVSMVKLVVVMVMMPANVNVDGGDITHLYPRVVQPLRFVPHRWYQRWYHKGGTNVDTTRVVQTFMFRRWCGSGDSFDKGNCIYDGTGVDNDNQGVPPAITVTVLTAAVARLVKLMLAPRY